MSSPAQPDVPIWTTVQELLVDDDRVTPQLQGFLSLAVPAGVMSATLYLEVPNDLTAAQINKRLRLPIMEALSHIGEEVTSYRVVVNHELAEQQTAPIAVGDFGRQSRRAANPPWSLRPPRCATSRASTRSTPSTTS